MKKIKFVLMTLLMAIVLLPSAIFAEEDTQKAPINVYIFRGEGCGFCKAALEFFSGIESSYGEYFDLVKYEVWSHEGNSALLGQVAEHLGVDADGVPYIVVGKTAFAGYNEQIGENIKELIKEEYNKDEKDRYDVMIDMFGNIPVSEYKEDYTSAEDNSSTINNVMTTISVVVIVGVVLAIVIARKGNDGKIETIKEVNEPEEIKKEVKKTEDSKKNTSNKTTAKKKNKKN